MLKKFPSGLYHFYQVLHKVNAVWGTKAPSNVSEWKAFMNDNEKNNSYL
jgi:hypothetical protein